LRVTAAVGDGDGREGGVFGARGRLLFGGGGGGMEGDVLRLGVRHGAFARRCWLLVRMCFHCFFLTWQGSIVVFACLCRAWY